MDDETEFFTPLIKYALSSSAASLETDTQYYTPRANNHEMTDSSDESTSSAQSNAGDLSLLAEFDELMRHLRSEKDEILDSFIDFVGQTLEVNQHIRLIKEENRRMRQALEQKTQACEDTEVRLKTARKLLDRERRERHRVEVERKDLESLIARVREVLMKDNRNRLPDETREKLAFLNNSVHRSVVEEVNTTGSLLSNNFSYTKSEDDLDISLMQAGKTWKKHRPSMDNAATAEPVPKKRRTSTSNVVEIGTADTIRATTTVQVEKDGPITATSIIESIPPEAGRAQKSNQTPGTPAKPKRHFIHDVNNDNNNNDNKKDDYKRGADGSQQHVFQTKLTVVPDDCTSCDKRINFGKTAIKCKNCQAFCHLACKDKLPAQCVPFVNLPSSRRNILNSVADYAPMSSPMVPALIVHCVNEIEERGLTEFGLYRISGSEGEVKALKQKFLKGSSPNLSGCDVHVLCSTIKSFLMKLSEPLLTNALRKDFMHAAEVPDKQDVAPLIYQLVLELPQPNRETLSCLILHLKKVSESKDCKMPPDYLARAIGPSLVGFSSNALQPEEAMKETTQIIKLVEVLLNLPSDYYAQFYRHFQQPKTPTTYLQQTPSTDSLLRLGVAQHVFTPGFRRMSKIKKNFATPPQYKCPNK